MKKLLAFALLAMAAATFTTPVRAGEACSASKDRNGVWKAYGPNGQLVYSGRSFDNAVRAMKACFEA